MVVAQQFQNGALARYPEAVTELAIFAIASSTMGFFQAGLNFTSQLANVYARSAAGKTRTHRFVSACSFALMAPLIVLVSTDAGPSFIDAVYGIDPGLNDRVLEYLAWQTPLILVTGQRMYLTGLLIQARLTAWVTGLNVVFLATTVAVLVLGVGAGWRAVYTLIGAQAAAGVLHLSLTSLAVRLRYVLPETSEHEGLTYRELFAFFLPVTTTGFMFAVSRPVLYAFVARTPDGIASIAALRVAFDLATIFQQAANQFRHFFVTFGLDDLGSKRLFMTMIAAGLTLFMLALGLTPLSAWLLNDLLGIEGKVLDMAIDVTLAMCPLPAIIIVRNYFHGVLMVKRRTNGMAAGGVLRVVSIYLLAQLAFAMGLLSHVSAASILILGFVFETATVAIASRRIGP